MTTYHEALEHNWNVIVTDVIPHMKDGHDPVDIISDIERQINSPQQGLRMRIPMMVTMLQQEASMPKGMSLTRKVAGGSPTASVKREFGLKKGLSKQRTYEVFSLLAEFTAWIISNMGDVYEIYDVSTLHTWDEDDGCYLYTPGVVA